MKVLEMQYTKEDKTSLQSRTVEVKDFNEYHYDVKEEGKGLPIGADYVLGSYYKHANGTEFIFEFLSEGKVWVHYAKVVEV
ncbi:hypothetical protein ACTFR8_23805 [Bacillus cereus group sp. MYBK15-3]|uniref:hypothetical protein n=1 Tax=Bacillus cereus group TaxID=86661 RepID=UPI001C8BCD74|nr:hypothetical protein [Bacillus cereus]MBX9158624.1 hypothetical protein [Bacillus cereus]